MLPVNGHEGVGKDGLSCCRCMWPRGIKKNIAYLYDFFLFCYPRSANPPLPSAENALSGPQGGFRKFSRIASARMGVV